MKEQEDTGRGPPSVEACASPEEDRGTVRVIEYLGTKLAVRKGEPLFIVQGIESDIEGGWPP